MCQPKALNSSIPAPGSRRVGRRTCAHACCVIPEYVEGCPPQEEVQEFTGIEPKLNSVPQTENYVDLCKEMVRVRIPARPSRNHQEGNAPLCFGRFSSAVRRERQSLFPRIEALSGYHAQDWVIPEEMKTGISTFDTSIALIVEASTMDWAHAGPCSETLTDAH